MKPLLFLPLFFLIHPWCTALVRNSSGVSESNTTSRSIIAVSASHQTGSADSIKTESLAVSPPATSP